MAPPEGILRFGNGEAVQDRHKRCHFHEEEVVQRTHTGEKEERDNYEGDTLWGGGGRVSVWTWEHFSTMSCNAAD